ncbi:MAG: PmoA family protein [Verrucomicrobiales bacterium]|nr:PmoA family protein [Verrucomicrobiales bacterium]
MSILRILTPLVFVAASVSAKEKKASAPLEASALKSIPVPVVGKPFTQVVYAGVPKPVLFPIIGPHGLEMTRNWPLRAAKAGEETDHPHHQSLWFTHGDVNGIDFWALGEKSGKILVKAVPVVTGKDGTSTVNSEEIWQGPDGKTVCTSETRIVCGAEGEDRYIDYTIAITASEGDVTFGDTKEGTMAVRVRPELNLPNKSGKATVVNDSGESGAAVWGKHAKWVDYHAPVEGHVVGVAAFDHPTNLRHPTTWHARDYGLIAANPFGLHDFEKKPKGTGNHTLKKGETLTFRYRWLFHDGDTARARIAERYADWAK